jgi:hypothetical protein
MNLSLYHFINMNIDIIITFIPIFMSCSLSDLNNYTILVILMLLTLMIVISWLDNKGELIAPIWKRPNPRKTYIVVESRANKHA